MHFIKKSQYIYVTSLPTLFFQSVSLLFLLLDEPSKTRNSIEIILIEDPLFKFLLVLNSMAIGSHLTSFGVVNS
jgi:hypothetical protein